ncbi:hypothetical protein [Micromonospora sp. DPT]|uniref:hypothetical protein n=1 Tax=Micromonospora sp. DPT TaxID=3142975 RepID=UPI0032094EC2
MSTTAPKPPTKRLLLAAGLTTGTTIGVWTITGLGNLFFSGIPASRMPLYLALGIVGTVVSGYLGTRYAIQKHRRDAWWDGFAAGGEPLAEVVQLRSLKAQDGDKPEWRAGSPT